MINKEMIKKVLLMVGLFWAVDRFIMSRFKTAPECEAEVRSGQVFVAPEKVQIAYPLNHTITVVDGRRQISEQKTKISTQWANLVFSSDGAVLDRLEFKEGMYGVNVPIDTIFPSADRTDRTFMVALAGKTPYAYTLVGESEDDQVARVTYESAYDEGVIRKQFIVYKQICKIDLVLELVPKSGSMAPVQARVFVPSPLISSLTTQQTRAVVQNVKGCVEKIAADALNYKEYRVMPLLVGSENRYFAHVLINDEQKFAQRAYYMESADASKLITIIEGPEVNHAQSWHMSWFMGPKDAHAMAAVDSRLDDVLDYSGWFAPVSKLLLQILNWLNSFLHNYGLAIIVLTLLLKLVLFPITNHAERRTKSDAKEMQRRMQHIEHKFKHDKERLRMEQAELVRKHALPQFGTMLMGALVQVPIIVGLNKLLSSAVDLYKAPFFGWITDLSSPDRYHILPALIALAMLIQALMGDRDKRFAFILGGVVVGFVSNTLPTGLVLYFVANSLIGMVIAALAKLVKKA